MSGAITAGVAAVGTLGMGVYNSVQQGRAASAQRGMQDTIFNEQQGYEKQLQSLIADPSQVTKLPGYQFQLQAGGDALARQMISQGFGGSGNLGEALIGYGQDYAQSAYQQQVNILSQLAGLGSTSGGQYGQLANQSQQQSWNQQGGLLASLMYLGKQGGAGGFGGMFGGGGSPAPVGLSSGTDSAGGTSPWAIPNDVPTQQAVAALG